MSWFSLYANCILVKGHTRSVIYDLYRCQLQFVPNDLYDIFEGKGSVNVEESVNMNGLDNREVILEYFDFLENQGYGCFSPEPMPELSTGLNTGYRYPTRLSNIIVDFDLYEHGRMTDIVSQLDDMHIRNVEVRVWGSDFNLRDLRSLHTAFYRSQVRNLDLVLPYGKFEDVRKEDYCMFRFSRILFYGGDQETSFVFNGTNVYLVESMLFSEACCGSISEKYFSVNIKTYTESLSFNSCLHRKISVDKEGYIRNCPSMPDTFGNIADTTLSEALSKAGFEKHWGIVKDDIYVCQDCEFRYACTDCRAYIEDPSDIYSKPLKCSYNPYIGEWNEKE